MSTKRVLISLEDVVVNFGGKPLFDGVGLHVLEGDRVCLVGRNGAGKTTMMRLLMGELELDGGERFFIPGLRMGYLGQKITHNPDETVKDFVLGGLHKEDEGDESQHYLADMALAPFALDANAPLKTLSGGQLRRAALARALVADPDILLLDEPTNHLDVEAIEWLEDMIKRFKGAVLCVSHDRAFLKNISQKVFWIDRGIIRTLNKGYSEYEDWAEQIIEQEARELHNMQKKLEQEVDWTQGGVSGRRKRNVRRLRELHNLREKLRAGKASYKQHTRGIELDPLAPAQASKIVAEFKNVSKHFERDGNKIPILESFNFRVMRGDKIGILGKNGSGKSTFLKLMLGELDQDAGHIKRGKNIEVSYFDQHRVKLKQDETVVRILCPDGGDQVKLGREDDLRTQHVCGYLKKFLFDPASWRDRVSTLSGGQQNRLLLAHTLAQPGNVLILDEPTNDLDMDTLDMLQEILSDYDGTLLLVSHDRDFLDRTVSKVLAFEGDAEVVSYVGGYSDYAHMKALNDGKATPQQSKGSAAPQPVKEVSAPASKAAVKISFKDKHAWETLPKRMEDLEAEMAEIRTLLSDSELYTKDPEAFDKASARFVKAQKELEEAETRWLELDELMASAAS